MKERNYGIDLLRMVSMLLVVILHIIGQGGIYNHTGSNRLMYYACWFPETAAYCAVDVYGLISGYVGVYSSWHPRKIVKLYLRVYFYSALITLLCVLFAPQFLLEDSMAKAFLPVIWETYWYFTAYVGVFFLMPFLNRMVLSLTMKERKALMLTIFLLFSAATAVPKGFGSDFFNLGGGYCFVWLLLLYLFGACLRCLEWRRWKRWQYLLGYLGCVTFSWAYKILMENFTRSVFGKAMYGRIFLGYCAPTIFGAAIFLFLIFEQTQIKNRIFQKIIAFMAPLAFSVYLIHTHPIIFHGPLCDAFIGLCSLPIPLMLLAIIVAALAIYLLCSLIDLVRVGIFRLVESAMGRFL